MNNSKMLFYLAIGLVLLIIYMSRPPKKKQPTALDMKARHEKRKFEHQQIEGSRYVEAEVENNLKSSSEEPISWASPTIVVDGKTMDAYFCLGLSQVASFEQVQQKMEQLLKQSQSSKDLAKIKMAYEAIRKFNQN